MGEIAGHFRRSPMRISQSIIEVEKILREKWGFQKKSRETGEGFN
jgi:hypothetical protein